MTSKMQFIFATSKSEVPIETTVLYRIFYNTEMAHTLNIYAEVSQAGKILRDLVIKTRSQRAPGMGLEHGPRLVLGELWIESYETTAQ